MAFDTTYTFKVSKEALKAFREAAEGRYLKNPNDLLREMMEAAAEGRITIHLTPEQEAALSLYEDLEE